ncbi:uncharacterized protein EDB91DRAFT_1337591 [Suillus paluster]|uniref:uncharacterized protein n=1 Tax=Suillus paluster TaxID=48578 RepID=UPI001B85BDA8|nr:uncharacterized protein EDB91DRAFT_1337591 [Suillus paluster]KAG1735721.1 hypothetical protein EDB91DRAFT_1337591 [Suillus paluster]
MSPPSPGASSFSNMSPGLERGAGRKGENVPFLGTGWDRSARIAKAMRKQVLKVARGAEQDVPVRDEYASIGLCSLLLLVQLLGQVLLIPQGTFFGQIMFLSAFAASWAYNLYLSSMGKEYIQQMLLLEVLNLNEQHMRTHSLGTRTTAAVFACLILQPRSVGADQWKKAGFEPEVIIHKFIPNNTPVWSRWREKILDLIRDRIRSQGHCEHLLQVADNKSETCP